MSSSSAVFTSLFFGPSTESVGSPHLPGSRRQGGNQRNGGAILDVVQFAGDARRFEVVVDGLPLFAGAQLVVDTILVSTLHANGEPHRGAADEDGVALVATRRRKERTYPELGCRQTCAIGGACCRGWREMVP